jgi:hypothetical protein
MVIVSPSAELSLYGTWTTDVLTPSTGWSKSTVTWANQLEKPRELVSPVLFTPVTIALSCTPWACV